MSELGPGSYSVKITDANGCSVTLNDLELKEYDFPEAYFEADPDSGEAPLWVQFTNLSTGKDLSYNWIFDDGTTSEEENPEHLYKYLGGKKIFWPTLIVTDSNGCISIDSNRVRIKIVPRIEFPNVFTPTTFTPNGDGINDKYTIEENWVTDIRLKIFNRWGVLVFETDRLYEGWDGKNLSGADVSEGTYFLQAQYKTIESEDWTNVSKSITLIR